MRYVEVCWFFWCFFLLLSITINHDCKRMCFFFLLQAIFQVSLSESSRIPGSSKCVKFVPFHHKNLPKGRNFTYLEDPGMTWHDECLYVTFVPDVCFFERPWWRDPWPSSLTVWTNQGMLYNDFEPEYWSHGLHGSPGCRASHEKKGGPIGGCLGFLLMDYTTQLYRDYPKPI